uniref:ATP-dependent DNA helicase n=1 Tax=Lactuca sativa TaxID=4236 RepID=A0A9R1VC84_LACSA|nr:hypothetical protein LSAT_V11C500276410 [Lactuca sativa]
MSALDMSNDEKENGCDAKSTRICICHIFYIAFVLFIKAFQLLVWLKIMQDPRALYKNMCSCNILLEYFTLMAQPDVTLILDLDVLKDDSTIKVRVINLWNLFSFYNKDELISIELILIDEQDTKIQTNVLRKNIYRFKNILKDGLTFYIKCPSFASQRMNGFTLTRQDHKLTFLHNTVVTESHDFSGPTFGFEFVDYQSVISLAHPQNMAIDVIGLVVAIGEMGRDSEDMKKHRLNIQIQDANGLQLNVNLWGDFAYKLQDFLHNNPHNLRMIVILQFAKLSIWRDRPTVNTYFSVSKLFINTDIDEINAFKKSLDGDDSPDSSTNTFTLLKSNKVSEHDDFMIYDSDTCPRQYRYTYLNHLGFSTAFYPGEINALKGLKLAFEISIKNFNVSKKNNQYSICRVSDDEKLIEELENKLTVSQVGNSQSFDVAEADFESQDTRSLKDAISGTDDNITPSTVDKNSATSPMKNLNTPKVLKRNLEKTMDAIYARERRKKRKLYLDNKKSKKIYTAESSQPIPIAHGSINTTDSTNAKERRKIRKLYLDNKKSKKNSNTSTHQKSSITHVSYMSKNDVYNRRHHLLSVDNYRNGNYICSNNIQTPLSINNDNSVFGLGMTSTGHSTIIQKSSSIKLPRGKHQLKRKTTHISPIPMIDLTLDEEINDEHIIEDVFRGTSKDYLDHGDQIVVCQICHAKLWTDESVRGKKKRNTSYSLCCGYGKVELPPLKEAPSSYKNLYHSVDSKSKHFMKNIRRYNSMFSFTSMGGKVDSTINTGNAPYIFRISGQNYHSMGSLLPSSGCTPKFCQLYIYDTDNEISNRSTSIGGTTRASSSTSRSYDLQIIEFLKVMLDSNNALVKSYRMVRDNLHENPGANLKLRLIGKREQDGRTYNLPTSSEIAALIVGDICDSIEKRDIIVETSSGLLKRISELHPSYLALQYPLLFPYGDDGYRVDILHRGVTSSSNSKRPTCTMREFFAYRIQDRDQSFSLILNAKRLFQQFLVDSYTMIESERLYFIRKQHKILRCESYDNLRNHQASGSTDISNVGQRVILPSSFIGGARYMMQNYLDAMSLCKWFGYPDFFITFTCNPKWPEVQRFLNDTPLHPEDRPDILCRLFKIKLDAFIKDLRENEIFGMVQAVVYTIEFQKRGLPHSHICLFMHSDYKLPTVEYIDPIISAEIPDIDEDRELYSLVKEFMIHGPCGAENFNCPCMVDGKCSKNFQKQFCNHTSVDPDGFPLYRRRNDGNFVEKSGVRYPAVIRLPFHLPGQQQVIYEADDDIEDVLDRPSVASSMFISWMKCNEINKEARKLTYVEFPTKFVWKPKLLSWQPRKVGHSIGRIHSVSPKLGETYFLRILLNKVKGPKSFEEIRTTNGEICSSFKDACYNLGLLDDDKEYIEAIKEASVYGSDCVGKHMGIPVRWNSLYSTKEIKVSSIVRTGLSLNEDQIKNLTLFDIEQILLRNNSSLKNYRRMPYPDADLVSSSNNRLIAEELDYDIPNLKNEFDRLFDSLTDEQRNIFLDIMAKVKNNKGGVFFIYGYGGTGRTAHSQFIIPINLTEDSYCRINPKSDLASLVRKASLIIWDEAPMVHKHAFEALDRTLKDILRFVDPTNSNIPFGGKVVVFGGDFRQILPVVPGGSRQNIVNASLSSSYLWQQCQVHNLTKNMRLTVGSDSSDVHHRIKSFSNWLLDIGEGNLGGPNDGEAIVDIPEDILINDPCDPIGSLINFVYPSILENFNIAGYFQERAILAPKNEVVQEINDRLLKLIPGEQKEYLSSDSLCQSEFVHDQFDANLYSPDVLNGLKISGSTKMTTTLHWL